jgi:dedicator of cytokinesis protein 3
VIAKNKDVSAPKGGGSLCVGLALLRGPLHEAMNAKVELSNVIITDKLGFPEVLLPGIFKNSFYISLTSGEFTLDKSSSVEVTICVRTDSGQTVSECIEFGRGDKPTTEFTSSVYYHNDNPKWNETFSLCLPQEMVPLCHLFLSLRQCSSSGSKEMGNAFLKLTKPDGTVIDDSAHVIQIFKPQKGDLPTFYLKDGGLFDCF